jgi:hypothetical protein
MNPALPPEPHEAATGKRRKRTPDRIQAVVACVAMIAILGLGYWLYRETASASRAADSAEAHADRSVGTIKLGREGDRCRHLTLDNRTGQIRDDGAQPCHRPVPGDPKEQLRERYSGGRLDAIRDSFRSR